MQLVWPEKGRCVRLTPHGPQVGDPRPGSGHVEAVEAVGDASLAAGWEERENLLVQGDAADVLSTLLGTLEGRVDLVYADPPFNTGTRYSAFDNAFDHGVWLSLLEERMRLVYRCLRPGGSLYLHLDPTESHYAKVLLDEIFGREAFMREIIWRIGWVSGFKTMQKNFVRNHDVILYYVKPGGEVTFHKTYLPYPKGYRRRQGKPGRVLGYPLEDTWNASSADPLPSIQIMSFSGEKTGFPTQKNENLVDRIVTTSSREGDVVLDPFAGSGTTAAVSHKRRRRYVAVELDEEAVQVAASRLRRVVAGEDRHGITQAAGWPGGGGFVVARWVEGRG
jgi:adenine-specific DNA-methyltransferase